jgi:8-oxo-dGTP diphosphatase
MKQVDVVGAVIIDEEGRILCARRSEQMSQAGLWEFPGGKIESDEAPEASLAREIAEELGCQIEIGSLVAEAVHDYPGVRVHLVTYWARVVSGTPVAREHAELRWVAPEDLGALDWAPADLPTVAALQAGALPSI